MTSVATLLFDSLTSKRLGGLRGYTSTMRQMLFTTGAFDIDIQISASSGQIMLSGQVLARNHRPASGDVELLRAACEVEAMPLTKFGEFQFAKLPPGHYELEIHIDDDSITIPEFELVS